MNIRSDLLYIIYFNFGCRVEEKDQGLLQILLKKLIDRSTDMMGMNGMMKLLQGLMNLRQS